MNTHLFLVGALLANRAEIFVNTYNAQILVILLIYIIPLINYNIFINKREEKHNDNSQINRKRLHFYHS